MYGIFPKLKLYYNLIYIIYNLYNYLIYPGISYSILAWGSVHKTHIKKIQLKQNHIVRLIFYAKTFGRETESAKPLLNLLDTLTVDNIYRLEVLKFSHPWHNDLLPETFHDIFQYARNMHGYNTRYTAKQNFYKYKVRTNTGKQSVSFMAYLEKHSIFFKRFKCVCISEANKTLPPVRTKTELIFH